MRLLGAERVHRPLQRTPATPLARPATTRTRLADTRPARHHGPPPPDPRRIDQQIRPRRRRGTGLVHVTAQFPNRVFAFDEFGPLTIRPHSGAGWAPHAKPARLPATTASRMACASSTPATRSAMTRCGAGSGTASPPRTPWPHSNPSARRARTCRPAATRIAANLLDGCAGAAIMRWAHRTRRCRR